MPGPDPLLVSAFAGQAARTQGWLQGLTAADAAMPSRLPGWRVAELAAHVAASPGAFTAAVTAPRPPRGTRPLTAAAYLAGRPGDTHDIPGDTHDITEDITEDITRGAPAWEARFARAAAQVAVVTAALGDTDPVLAAGRGPLRASDLLRTRVLELVVHALDADAGPTLDRQAVRVCVRLLASVAAERHPGRSIEIRVPPYAAVQIGESGGPTHTRGTPPNVVECAPEVFVAVATGRRSWPDAAAAGEIRASGSRADLRPYLPLI